MSGPRVLLVEDDESIVELLVQMLSAEGYDVVAARDGAAALTLAQQHQFDLILLDVRLPVMDGDTFTRIYRDGPGPHAPIVVTTAGHQAERHLALPGVVDVIPKPFDVDELLATIARHAPLTPLS